VKYFFISGESSGDHLSSLIAKELIQTHSANIKAMGGHHLAESGVDIIQHIDSISVMGWQEVISALPKFMRIMAHIKKEILRFNPDTIVLVDFGSFNLRLAKWCKKQGYKVVYFIPPKVWASREHRIEALKQYCDQIIVLFPFEKKYFNSKGLNAEYHGYPLANIRNETQRDSNFHSNYNLGIKPIIAILPGSRPQEIKYLLTPILQAAVRFQDYQICISQAEGLRTEILEKYIPKSLHSQVKIVSGKPYQLLLHSEIAIVTSGTATLECALLDTPMVVCYKTNLLNYLIAKRIIKVPYISLPNLILSDNVVPELIQERCSAENIYSTIKSILKSAQLSMQKRSFSNIYKQLYSINTISSIGKAINNQGQKLMENPES
jgi:lipid-A-disaccharide synthase